MSLACGAPAIPVGDDVDDSGAASLVTKAGQGTLSVGTTPLVIKEAKPLPVSD